MEAAVPATSEELFRDGKLREAIAAQTAAVRAAPGEVNRRWFLVELLCFAEEWDRGDQLLDVISTQAEAMAAAVLRFRGLLRGEQTRRQVMREGRAPQMIGQSAPLLQPVAEALLSLREGDPATAAGKLAEAAAQAPPVAGTYDGTQSIDTFRDIDDVCAPFVEFITEGGDYHWVAVVDISLLEVQPLQRPRDLIWRPSRLEVRDGPAGEVYLPALYVTDRAEIDDAIRLGRGTDWHETQGGPVRGVGQRTFLVGDDDIPIHELRRIEFGAGLGG
ncbi:MAG TPA: type VI secretion system accessory protein TagJ [Stellaceae bacterium]|jgi:type VI secretion system protein ImpE